MIETWVVVFWLNVPTIKAWAHSEQHCEQIGTSMHEDGYDGGWFCVKLGEDMVDFRPILEYGGNIKVFNK